MPFREAFFKPRIGTIAGAYCDSANRLVLMRDASLPERCIVCAAPARGNTRVLDYQPYEPFSLHATIPRFLYWLLGKHYLVDFPACSTCKDGDFDIRADWIDDRAGIFRGISNTLLRSLPQLPSEIEGKLNPTLPQRLLRFFR